MGCRADGLPRRGRFGAVLIGPTDETSFMMPPEKGGLARWANEDLAIVITSEELGSVEACGPNACIVDDGSTADDSRADRQQAVQRTMPADRPWDRVRPPFLRFFLLV